MNEPIRDTDAHDAPIAALQGLDPAVYPSHDLWPGIESRLGRRRAMSANGWMSLAAAACVVVIVGLAVVEPRPLAESAAPAAASALTQPGLDAIAGNRALVRANLQLARSSEQQIRQALKQDPDSASLQRLLRSTESRSQDLRRMLAAPPTG